MENFRYTYLARCKELDVPAHPVVLEQASLAAIHGAAAGEDSAASQTGYPHTLVLSGHALDKRACAALGAALANDLVFTSLELSDCFLNDDGVIVLCKCLRTNPTLQRIDFRGNNVQSDGAIGVASLVSVSTSLKSLILEWNSIGLWNDGVKAIADALSSTATLEELDLRNNKIGPQAVELLANALKYNTSLKRLDLRWNNAGLLGGRALADIFRWNHTLLHLDVSGNEVPEEYLKTIAVSLGRNADRYHNIATNQRQAQSLSATLQSIQASHNETIKSLQQQIAASDSQTQSISKKLNKASEEITESQRHYRAAQEQAASLRQERDSLQALLVQERGEWQTRKHDYEREVVKLRQELEHSQHVYKTGRAEWTGEVLELEARLRETELRLESYKRDSTALADDVKRSKEREQDVVKQCEDKVQALELSYARKLQAAQAAKDEEHREQVKKLEDRLRALEVTRSAIEEELDAYKTRSRNQKTTWDEKLLEVEQRLRREQEARESDAQKRLEAMRQSRDSVQEQLDRHIHTHTQTLKQHDMTCTQLHAELTQRHEQLVAARAQLAAALAQSQADQTQAKDVQSKYARAAEDVERLRRDLSAAVSAKEHGEAELARARKSLAAWEEKEEARRREDLERLKGLEHAFGSFIRGSISSRQSP
ncbi:Leucine-rich repeat-containing protein 45 [Sorochytrium milnesiophthora]